MIVFCATGLVLLASGYCTARLFLLEALEQLRVLYHGYGIKLLHAEQAPPAGVDTPADLDRVRARLGS